MSAINDEVLMRIRRIETRLWKLCEHEGVEAPVSNPVELVTGKQASDAVLMKGFDVTLASIRKAIVKKGADLTAEGGFELWIDDKRVGWMEFER